MLTGQNMNPQQQINLYLLQSGSASQSSGFSHVCLVLVLLRGIN